jgi:hypothetical protein
MEEVALISTLPQIKQDLGSPEHHARANVRAQSFGHGLVGRGMRSPKDDPGARIVSSC